VLPAAPAVYLTLGTVFHLESGDLLERALAGLRALPANVLVTVGPHRHAEELGPQPAHVRVAQYVPQETVLPHCDLVVSHGGSGSVLGALAHGLPLVLLPLGADQPLNADRCAALGVAEVLDAVEATPERVRAAAAAVLGDPTARRAAAALRDEIASLPAVDRAVAALARLAGGRGPRPA
jgi:MGT family glycosyltransferase